MEQPETLTDLKKQRTRLHIMQIALGDYPKTQDVKDKIALSLKAQLVVINAKIEKLERETKPAVKPVYGFSQGDPIERLDSTPFSQGDPIEKLR